MWQDVISRISVMKQSDRRLPNTEEPTKGGCMFLLILQHLGSNGTPQHSSWYIARTVAKLSARTPLTEAEW